MTDTKRILPTFSGEVQFRRYSDTSSQGQQIVLQVAGRAELEAFIGKEGKRFMAVLVEIGDDELPVQSPPNASTRPVADVVLKEGPKRTVGPKCNWLAMRCKDAAFQLWLVGGENEAATAERCRELCKVESRYDIDGDAEAEALFEKYIRKPWEQFTKTRSGPISENA